MSLKAGMHPEVSYCFLKLSLLKPRIKTVDIAK